MFSLIVGVVCVVVVTLLLLGASIVEPRLIHYYDAGVVCVVCVLELCVLCSCVLRVVDDGCVVDQGVFYSYDIAVMYIVDFAVHRIAVGFFVFIRVACCACRVSVVVSISLIQFCASVDAVSCFRCAFESVFLYKIVIKITLMYQGVIA